MNCSYRNNPLRIHSEFVSERAGCTQLYSLTIGDKDDVGTAYKRGTVVSPDAPVRTRVDSGTCHEAGVGTDTR